MKPPAIKFFLSILFAFFAINFQAQYIFNLPLSNRQANYIIRVNLNTENKMLTAVQKLTYINQSADTLTELQFHAYMNAFMNNQSTFMKESNRPGSSGNPEWDFGFLKINKLSLADSANLLPSLTYFSPDDNNPDDRTVFKIKLPGKLMPKDSVILNFEFEVKLPKIIARTGYERDYFFIAQWFPKIGVYEPAGMRYAKRGAWNCHQFHANSEFYSNFGTYDVYITLPQEYVVGSGGKLMDKKEDAKGLTTWYFRAEDIVDFAWTASKRYKVAEKQWNHVKIQLLYQPEHKDLVQRHFDATIAALEYFEETLETFPYPHLTIVDPPFYGMGSSGMEYTTLFTAGSFWNEPEGLRFTEMVTVHEFGHAYFMGMLASNEFEEAWLDEGFNSYFETKILDHYYGKNTGLIDIAGIQIGDFEFSRSGYASLKNKGMAEIYRNAWDYPYGGYGVYSYQKPAVVLQTLEGIVGEKVMYQILKTYFKRWKFKHPSTRNFIEIAAEVIEANSNGNPKFDINQYFSQTVYGSGHMDYAVTDISNQLKPGAQGWFETTGNLAVKNEKSTDQYESYVQIERFGEVILPVEVLVKFSSGREVLETFDSDQKRFRLKYSGPDRVVSATIDPNFKIPLDTNVINNSYSITVKQAAKRKIFATFLFWLQNFIQFFI